MKWIKVTDKLPPKDVDVLIYADGHNDCQDIARYRDVFGWDTNRPDIWDSNITHWAELPDIPIEI